MATVTTGVYPVYDNVFKIGVKGSTSTKEDMKTIADCETFSLSMDNNVEEWTPMTTEGWIRRMQTGKGFSIRKTHLAICSTQIKFCYEQN